MHSSIFGMVLGQSGEKIDQRSVNHLDLTDLARSVRSINQYNKIFTKKSLNKKLSLCYTCVKTFVKKTGSIQY